MRTNKFGNYKLFRTLGEGAFAKVKRTQKNYNIIPFNNSYSWYP